MINGALVGTGAGTAGGFVNGTGNAWANGTSFGQGLASSFIGASKGLVTGAFTGGLIRGTMDALNGHNFWNGTKIYEVANYRPIFHHQASNRDEQRDVKGFGQTRIWRI